MRVKRLEIQGFKSFKDKTVIHFDHGITGIVGPNGCGKSNIVDAFFWVMGEQSYKHMRGSSSEDLIFNGSAKYSPLGMAEATLVLETDVIDTANGPAGASFADLPQAKHPKEVSVTRRLYRSGEGEYFVNGVSARLKDIHELFMDTGVGAKGYSVIEQGQIGKIVNAKPEDRRLLVEEAAGIAKYKARKKESLRKMEATQSNLSRLGDVIQEIERNLNSLDRQAQKARLYRRYKDELLDKEMTWGRRKNLLLKLKQESLRALKEAFDQELVGLRAELQTTENAMEVDRIANVSQNKAAEELQNQVQKLSDELTTEKSALDLSRRRQSDLENQLRTLQNEQNELQLQIVHEGEKLASKQGEAIASEQAFSLIAGRAQGLQERVKQGRDDAQSGRQNLESTRRSLMVEISQASELSSRSAAITSQINSAQSHSARLEQQISLQSNKLAEVRAELEKNLAQAASVRDSSDAMLLLSQEKSRKISELEEVLHTDEILAEQSKRNLTSIQSRLQSLTELAETFEGFGNASKAALEFSRGSLQPLADAYEIDSKYDCALEGWLDKRVEDLLSEDSTQALSTLDHLKSTDQGRVSIYLAEGNHEEISAAEDFKSLRAVLLLQGFSVIGELIELVPVNSTLSENSKQVARKILSRVCLVENFSALPELIRNQTPLSGWSLVSLAGDVFDSSKRLTGGKDSQEKTGAARLLQRRRAILELQSEIIAAEAASLKIETNVNQQKGVLKFENHALVTLQGERQFLEVRTAALERDVHQAKRSVQDQIDALELLNLERKEVGETVSAANAEKLQTETEISAAIQARSALEGEIAAAEATVFSREEFLKTIEDELQALRIEEAALRERTLSSQRELEMSRSLIVDREKRSSDIQRTLERAGLERTQFTGGESELENKIEELIKILSSAREELSKLKDQIEQTGTRLTLGLERIKELHKAGDEKTVDSNQLALDYEKISSELTHLVQNLEEKYGPGCIEKPVTSPIQEEMNDPVITTEMTAEEERILGEEVEKLRERIRRLGEVNVMAIEEYDVLKKRSDYLLSEKSDLEHSIENLQDAIEHINKTSEDRFKKAFEAISNRFERLFPIIFGGGNARLSLVYPEGSNDILEAGVDILAQPPGKKISNIALLSGGEKALTAVSMIFAIFMVKPSPFCVLDEVDAPLDDANIGKFNALLKEMSAKSQFILITHNKKSMELNDTLYGVTMEEPGVSKMVSIEMH